MKTPAASLLALAVACAPGATRADAAVAPPSSSPAPRLALALSGGGARGVAHVGVLRALEEAGIPIDAIAANSMGSIVGAVYASGQDAKGLERIVRSMDWESLFGGRPDRRILPISRRVDRYRPLAGVNFDLKGGVKLPGGLIAEHRVNRFLIENLAPAGFAAGETSTGFPSHSGPWPPTSRRGTWSCWRRAISPGPPARACRSRSSFRPCGGRAGRSSTAWWWTTCR